MFDADTASPVAKALGTSDSSVTLEQEPSGWCARVTVRRLTAERDVFLRLHPDGELVPVEEC